MGNILIKNRLHIQIAGQYLHNVKPAASFNADIHLLKRHQMRVFFSNHIGNSSQIDLIIQTSSMSNIIGKHPESINNPSNLFVGFGIY